MERAFDTLPIGASTPLNSHSSGAGRHHDRDIDSPLLSPYSTLDKTQAEARGYLRSASREQTDGKQMSVSPPSLPTPDFSGFVPPPQTTEHETLNNLDPQVQTHPHQLEFPLQQNFPTSTTTSQPAPPSPTKQKSHAHVHFTPSPQQPTFHNIPAKRDYQSPHSSGLEQHYFPQPESMSTPNLQSNLRTVKPVQRSNPNMSSGGQATAERHHSLPPSASTKTSNTQSHYKYVTPTSPAALRSDRQNAQFSSGARQSPDRHPSFPRSPMVAKPNRTNYSPKRERKNQYIYSTPSKVKNYHQHSPKVSTDHQQTLFGYTVPYVSMAPNNISGGPQSPWKPPQKSPVPAHVVPQPINRSPVHSNEPVAQQHQNVPETTAANRESRPHSYSEGSSQTSPQHQQGPQRHKSIPDELTDIGAPSQPHPQPHPSQYSPRYLGRSPGAPRRGPQTNYYTPSDRTKLLNLTWTPPHLHHDPAISNPYHQHRVRASHPGGSPGRVISPHSPYRDTGGSPSRLNPPRSPYTSVKFHQGGSSSKSHYQPASNILGANQAPHTMKYSSPPLTHAQPFHRNGQRKFSTPFYTPVASKHSSQV